MVHSPRTLELWKGERRLFSGGVPRNPGDPCGAGVLACVFSVQTKFVPSSPGFLGTPVAANFPPPFAKPTSPCYSATIMAHDNLLTSINALEARIHAIRDSL